MTTTHTCRNRYYVLQRCAIQRNGALSTTKRTPRSDNSIYLLSSFLPFVFLGIGKLPHACGMWTMSPSFLATLTLCMSTMSTTWSRRRLTCVRNVLISTLSVYISKSACQTLRMCVCKPSVVVGLCFLTTTKLLWTRRFTTVASLVWN